MSLEQHDDRRMRKPRSRQRLSGRACALALACKRYALERNLAVEQLVVRPPHLPEAARAEPLQQPVAIQHDRVRSRNGGRRRAARRAPRSTGERVRGLHRMLAFATGACGPCQRPSDGGAMAENLHPRHKSGRQSYLGTSRIPARSSFCRFSMMARTQSLDHRPERPAGRRGMCR